MLLIPFELRKILCEMSIPFLVKQSIFENELVVNFEEIITILKEKSGQFL